MAASISLRWPSDINLWIASSNVLVVKRRTGDEYAAMPQIRQVAMLQFGERQCGHAGTEW